MPAYKRSNPAQLQKDREAISKDQESKGPGIFERVMGGMAKRVNKRRQRQGGYGPPPQVKGAMQYGRKKEDDTA